MKFTTFNIFKNNKKTDAKHPDYVMQVSEKQADGTYKNYDVAGIWLKDMSNGSKFMSGMMKKTYNDRAGYVIEQESITPMADAIDKAFERASMEETKIVNNDDFAMF